MMIEARFSPGLAYYQDSLRRSSIAAATILTSGGLTSSHLWVSGRNPG
nr:hypothetical protein [Rhizobium rhizogenes]